MNQSPLSVTCLSFVFCLLFPSCASLPESVKREDGRVLIQGGSKYGTKVLIRSIDDGDILFIHSYELGDRAWVDPGEHDISVMCNSSFPGGYTLAPGDITFEAKPNFDYTIRPASAHGESRRCSIEVDKSPATKRCTTAPTKQPSPINP